jgi:hypothetical protein
MKEEDQEDKMKEDLKDNPKEEEKEEIITEILEIMTEGMIKKETEKVIKIIEITKIIKIIKRFIEKSKIQKTIENMIDSQEEKIPRQLMSRILVLEK